MSLLLGEHDAQIHGRLLPHVINQRCSLACPRCTGPLRALWALTGAAHTGDAIFNAIFRRSGAVCTNSPLDMHAIDYYAIRVPYISFTLLHSLHARVLGGPGPGGPRVDELLLGGSEAGAAS
jgi:hypothetical protein